MNACKKFIWAIFSFSLMISSQVIADENETPSGTLVIDETQISLILGGSSGGGTLQFNGKSYDFITSGMKLGGIGVQKLSIVGEVYGLDDIADFPGDYIAAEAGITAGKAGAGVSRMKNSKGVRLHLKNVEEKGAALAIGIEGFTIKMK